MFGLGTPELILFCFVALLLFGTRLPGVMRSIGKGFREFKNGVEGIETEMRRVES